MRRIVMVVGALLLAANLAVASENMDAAALFSHKECGYQVGQSQGWCVNLILSGCVSDSQCVDE